MSFISERLKKADAQLGRYQILSKSNLIAASSFSQTAGTAHHQSTRTDRLESAIKLLSNASADGTILHPKQLFAALEQAGLSDSGVRLQLEKEQAPDALRDYHEELEWVLVSKAAVQTQGWLLTLFLAEIAPVMEDIYYWDGVLGSWRYSALYMVQKIPEKLWHTSRAVVRDAQARLREVQAEDDGPVEGLTRQWQRFYGLVREQVRERKVIDIQARLESPINLARQDASARLKGLNKQKEMCAAAIGILASESLKFEIEPHPIENDSTVDTDEDWKETVAQSVKLMSQVLVSVTNHNLGTYEYGTIAIQISKDQAPKTDSAVNVSTVLGQMLADTFPEHLTEYHKNRTAFGRPSRLVRYWIPALVLTLSSSTILRIVVARRAAIITWIRELGQTSIDFWYNWVVDPIKHVIGTIRHDQSSEIALMSRESLEGDRASLERMVVDFAIENPDTADGRPLSDAQVDQLRSKVREGDLTPVLKAYEYDLKRPLLRAATGNLIRELLIQIQKTKVDVEVAMAGIDSLLKSQELVFGFVSLTPGFFVCVALGRWLAGIFGGRKGRARGDQQTRLIRILRNIDYILTNADPQEDGKLAYRDHGLVLCEVQYLQSYGEKILPGDVYRAFLSDLQCLTDINQGHARHLRVVERLRWAYWKWLI